MGYSWSWEVLFELSPDGVNTYVINFMIGAGWTLLLASVASAFGMAIGAATAAMSVSGETALSVFAAVYVEILRNVPLIVQMFLWYFVLPELVPQACGLWIKQLPQPWNSFLPALLCMTLYASARMSDVLRAGIQSLPRGQLHAAFAVGLSKSQALRYVIFPQAFRIVIPALTSELVSAVKYSSIAFTIGLMEITAQAKSMQEYTFHVFEAFITAGIVYLTINWAVILCSRLVERRLAIPGLIGSVPESAN